MSVKGFWSGSIESWVSARWLRASVLVVAALGGAAVLATGCLDRPVVKASPTTSNVFVDQISQTSVDKIDLLFMVDNSTSMADKQDILRRAVPALVTRLTSPICVDASGAPVGGNAAADGKCPTGQPEFPPIGDIHVGIVTSSLGAHGGGAGSVCFAPLKPGDTPNDRAHLLGTVRAAGSNADPKLTFDAAKTWNNSGFLAWDASQKDAPPGIASSTDFKSSFQDMIAASGEHGCGFEASLESWYRFLVDPEPPANITQDANQNTVRGSVLVTNADGTTTCNGCDQDLLAQRKAFLRPDSLVAIVMLSDENDCSIRDDGKGWFVGAGSHMPKSTAPCATDPNDACCRSCALVETNGPPQGCSALAADPVCMGAPAGKYNTWDGPNDSPNLRCFNQKQRFGFDLLYPTSRYVDALRNPTLTLQSDGKTQVPNPLFDTGASGKAARSPTLVFLAGIVGVPWQDIADDASLASPTALTYLSASELVDKHRWPMLLGDPSAMPPAPPSDPFMIETPAPRPVGAKNPITMDPIVAPDSTNPTASPINGHEQNVPNTDDLQYACTFKLTAPKTCAVGDTACDCSAQTVMGTVTLSDVVTSNSPLCQPPTGGAATNVQSYAKAYPGARELGVLKDFQDQGIVASICPKVTEGSDSDPNFGYNPAVGAIIERLKAALNGKCLPRKLETDPHTHQASCRVIEARPAGCDCSLPGRAALLGTARNIIPAVENQLQTGGQCGVPGKPACESFCECEVVQETGDDLTACQQDKDPSTPGYCYIEDEHSPAVANCPANQKRILRFFDSPTNRIPASDAYAFIACLGAPIEADAGPDGAPDGS